MCFNASSNKRNIWTGRKKKVTEDPLAVGVLGSKIGKNIDTKQARHAVRGPAGLAGRLIK